MIELSGYTLLLEMNCFCNSVVLTPLWDGKYLYTLYAYSLVSLKSPRNLYSLTNPFFKVYVCVCGAYVDGDKTKRNSTHHKKPRETTGIAGDNISSLLFAAPPIT